MARTIIPYNTKLKQLAKELRQNMTFSEVELWNEIKNGKLMGYDFDRQRPIGNFIVDFYCKDLKLAIEIDGITHEDEKTFLNDKIRQEELETMGVAFLRFDALLVINKVEAVVREIRNWIERFESKHEQVHLLFEKEQNKYTHPFPSTEGMHSHSTSLFEEAL